MYLDLMAPDLDSMLPVQCISHIQHSRLPRGLMIQTLGQTSCEIPLIRKSSKNLPNGDAGSLDGWRISQDLRTPWTPDDRQRIRVTTAGHACSVELELGLERQQDVICWGLPGVNFVEVDNNPFYTRPSVRRQRVPSPGGPVRGFLKTSSRTKMQQPTSKK